MGVALNPWNVENFKDLSGSPSKESIPTGGTRDAKGMGVARQPVNEILQEFCLQKIPTRVSCAFDKNIDPLNFH